MENFFIKFKSNKSCKDCCKECDNGERESVGRVCGCRLRSLSGSEANGGVVRLAIASVDTARLNAHNVTVLWVLVAALRIVVGAETQSLVVPLRKVGELDATTLWNLETFVHSFHVSFAANITITKVSEQSIFSWFTKVFLL